MTHSRTFDPTIYDDDPNFRGVLCALERNETLRVIYANGHVRSRDVLMDLYSISFHPRSDSLGAWIAAHKAFGFRVVFP